MVQVYLRSTGTEMITWVDKKKPIKVGNQITLKNHADPSKLWEVVEIYGRNTSTIHGTRKWAD